MFYFYKDQNGSPSELTKATAFGSITQGDAVRRQLSGDTNAGTDLTAVLTVDTHDAAVVGVASHDASSGDDVVIMKATQGVLFGADASTTYDASTMGYGTGVDYSTDGQSVVGDATTSFDAFIVLGTVDNTDNTDVFGYFVYTEDKQNS